MHDGLGIVLASLATNIPFIFDPTVAKALVAWKVIVFSNELGFPV